MKKIVLSMIIALFLLSCQPMVEKNLYPGGFGDQRATWTIMIYMNGDNSLGGFPDFTTSNINDLESIEIPQNSNIIVLRDKPNSDDTRIIRIKQDPIYSQNFVSEFLSGTIHTETITPSSGEVNMLNENVFESFINYSITNYPADNYAVILWSHSDGWRASEESFENTRALGDDGNKNGMLGDYLSNKQIAQKLNGKNIDVVLFDSCNQGTMEALWAMKTQSDVPFMVASPYLVPGAGYNYKGFLATFFNSYMRPIDMAVSAVVAYKAQYLPQSFAYTPSLVAYYVSALNTTVLNDFFTWANTNKSLNNPTFSLSERSVFYTQSELTSDTGPNMRNFTTYAHNTSYPQKSELISTLNNVVLTGWRYPSSDTSYSGIGIYASAIQTEYDTSVPLANDTVWDSFLQ